MRLAVFFSGALLGPLAGKGTGGGGPWEEACPGLLTSLFLKAWGQGMTILIKNPPLCCHPSQ